MAFVIKPMQHADLEEIYAPGVEEQVCKLTYKKSDWPPDMHRANWAKEDSTGAFLFLLPVSRDDVGNRYFFGFPEGVILLREESYCLFSITYVSPGLANRLEYAKEKIREAFRAAGELVDGTTDERSTFAVPDAQFIANKKSEGSI